MDSKKEMYEQVRDINEKEGESYKQNIEMHEKEREMFDYKRVIIREGNTFVGEGKVLVRQEMV